MNKLFAFFVLLVTCHLSLATFAYAHSSTQVIEMTEEGFVPNELIVDQNQAVIFLNKDSKSRWPASNVHPTHDLYPEFDPKKPIEPGKSWVFKGEEIGAWKYHDHLNPHMRGILTVNSEQGTVSSPSFLEIVRDKILKYISQIKSIFSLAKRDDAAKNWQELKQKYKGQAGSEGNIHDLAHQAGGLLYEKLGFDGLAKCSAEFAFGCFHGFLDKAFAKNLDHLTDAQDACLKLGPDGSGPVGSCIHGIGHGVASFHLTADLKASLAGCRKLTHGREFCFDGVFMEFVRSAPDSFYSKDKPLYPCDELEKQFGPVYSQACGRNQPSLLMSRFKLRFEEVIQQCLKSSSNLFKQACFDSIGFSIASSADPDQIIKGCQAIGIEEYVITCEKSAAGELIFQEAPGWDEKSQKVCNSTPKLGQNKCFEHIRRIISDYGRKKANLIRHLLFLI